MSLTTHCKPGVSPCRICRAPTTMGANWRLHHEGKADFDCPHGLPMITVRGVPVKTTPPPKPVKRAKASPEVVEERLSIPCDKRLENGICGAGCKSCGGPKTCRTLAEWRSCPEKHW